MHAPVSVVIPCYRCADTIGTAVESVLLQTWPVAEIILVEDCSGDGGVTLAALQRLKAAHASLQIHVVQLESNLGPGGARNAGWAIASEDYLAFLDADDSWHPRKTELQLGWMQAHPDAMLCAGRSMQLGAGVTPDALDSLPVVYRVRGSTLLRSNCFPTRSVMLRRQLGLRFDPSKRYTEDYLLWLQIVLSGMPAYVIDLPLAYTYKAEYGASGLTASLWKMECGEIDTYQRLRAQGLISKTGCYFLMVYSFLKFMRRLLFCAVRQQSLG